MLILHFKKIYRKTALMSLLLICSLALLYSIFIRESGFGVFLQGGMCVTFQVMPYIFLFMMFFSYEVLYSFRKDEFNELLCCKCLDIKSQKYDMIWITIYGMLVSGVIFFFLIMQSKGLGYSQRELQNYFIRFAIIYVVLPIILAELIGWLISCIKNRIVAMCMLFVCFYCFDTTFLQSVVGWNLNNEMLFKLGTLFALFDSQATGAITDPFYFVSVENIHIYCVMFWILAVLAVILFLAKKKIGFGISLILSCLCFVMFWQPSGASYALPVVNGFDRWMGEQYYYTVDRQKEDQANYVKKNKNDFAILGYDMDIQIKDILKAEVTADLSTEDLDSYQFTLYHSYKLKAVKDQNGNLLEYYQDGDYVEVINKNKNLKSITFEYEGANQYFYSTSQGVTLPANYAYYPMAGWKTVFIRDSYNICFAQELPDDNMTFSLKISIPKKMKIFTNITTEKTVVERNRKILHYNGASNGLTIMGSYFLRDMDIEGVKVVYSCLDKENTPEDPQIYESYKNFFNEIEFQGDNVIFFAAPEENYNNVCFGNNQIVDQLYKVPQDYEKYCKQGNTYYIPTEEDEAELEAALKMLD